jgi:hypothetical protein
MRTKKGYLSIDNVYNNDESWGAPVGYDCLYRALQVQGRINLDINFGIMLCKRKLVNGHAASAGSGYVCPYGWHVWNEDDDNVYDSEIALTNRGIDVSQVDDVLVVDAPKIKTEAQLEKYIKALTKSFNPTKAPSIIYVAGIGQAPVEGVLNDDDFNQMLDEADMEFNLTGSTTTNLVKIV